jgi:signal transduction histidine kinase
MRARRTISIDLHPNVRSLVTAERELAAFVSAVNQLYGYELAGRAAEYWLKQLEETELRSQYIRSNWRQITIATAARLANIIASNSSISKMPLRAHFMREHTIQRSIVDESTMPRFDTFTQPPVGSVSSEENIKGAGKWECDRQVDTNSSDIRKLRKLLVDRQEELSRVKSRLLEVEPLVVAGRMTRSISHDFRNHLTAIYSNVESIGKSKTQQSNRNELVKEVWMTIHDMTEILDSILLFAQTGRTIQQKWESLNRLIEHTVTMVRSHPEAANVDITIRDTTSIEGWLDRPKIGSAVYNLLLNACQAANRVLHPRSVEVGLSEINGYIYIRVRDNGPGVPAEIRETLFQPFVGTGRNDGRGLGLAIAERAALQHGGFLDLELSTPGNTVFVMQISKFALEPLSEDKDLDEYPL